jgi:NADH dehydrogenase
VLLGKVTAADLGTRTVCIEDAEPVRYDYLVLASGVGNSYFGHEDWQRDAPALKTLEDALEIRRRVLLAFERAEHETDDAARAALMTFVVVGGGPTGVELGRAADIARTVLVSVFAPSTCGRKWPSSSRAACASGLPGSLAQGRVSLRRLGVNVLCGAP